MTTEPSTADSRLVFGYGSLVDTESLARFLGRPLAAGDCRYASLRGHVRCWNVAMDNSVDVPGYRYFVDPAGARPRAHVAFLNVSPEAGFDVNGVVVRMSSEEFAKIERRERNYRLTDVSRHLDFEAGEAVFASLGTPEAVARFERARRRDEVVIGCAYLQGVESAFRAAGTAFYRAYRASTRPPGVRCLQLSEVGVLD